LKDPDGPVRADRRLCERVGSWFWAEPLNAVSNVTFILAAGIAARSMPRPWSRDRWGALLVALVALVGIGSFLFYTLANRWSAFADVVPIALFIHVYLFVALRRFLGLGPTAAGAAVLIFAIGSVPVTAALEGRLAALSPELAGSAGYGPALLMLVGVGLAAWRRETLGATPHGGGAGLSLLSTGGLFAFSLLIRSADHAVCGVVPAGVHWAWHILNALVLFRLVRIALLVGPPGRQGRVLSVEHS
jgi:hypothetical protein